VEGRARTGGVLLLREPGVDLSAAAHEWAEMGRAARCDAGCDKALISTASTGWQFWSRWKTTLTLAMLNLAVRLPRMRHPVMVVGRGRPAVRAGDADQDERGFFWRRRWGGRSRHRFGSGEKWP